jgi:hypothetical protein
MFGRMRGAPLQVSRQNTIPTLRRTCSGLPRASTVKDGILELPQSAATSQNGAVERAGLQQNLLYEEPRRGQLGAAEWVDVCYSVSGNDANRLGMNRSCSGAYPQPSPKAAAEELGEGL